tara:strand:- start:427 stop:534 length:108 start_codon:yes stop_codon:yes gene_type:complete
MEISIHGRRGRGRVKVSEEEERKGKKNGIHIRVTF